MGGINGRLGFRLAHVRHLSDDIASGWVQDVEGAIGAGSDPDTVDEAWKGREGVFEEGVQRRKVSFSYLCP